MRRIVRRNLVRDPSGRPISVQSERVTDDGRGLLQQTSERTAAWCSGCRRPLADFSDARGVCDWCHARGCCVHCLSQCQVCSRRLCGHCRHGFAGPPVRTVCGACHQRLLHRQLLQDRQAASVQELARHQAALAHELARHRLYQQDEALRLHRERTYLMAQIQAARYGLSLRRERPLKRVVRAVGNVLRTVVRHAWRGLGGNPPAGGLPARR
jgi:hypothetical protein